MILSKPAVRCSERDRSRPELTWCTCQPRQSTATSRALQMSCMRRSASRPSRVTSRETETLSTESRLTAERRGTGSSTGSRTTSLGSPLIVVVQGATSARPSRGIAASRDRTTTGRRPISASSHHQSSPRAGSGLTPTRERSPASVRRSDIRVIQKSGRPHNSTNNRAGWREAREQILSITGRPHPRRKA